MPRLAHLQKLQTHAPLLVAALLLCLFAVYLATQINQWRQLVGEPASGDRASAQPQGATPDLKRIEQLFGAPPSAPPASGGPAPETDLGLTLHGSLVSRNGSASSAIIQMQGQPPELYAAGSELAPGVSLQAVYPDRVEISRNGRTETLRFPDSRVQGFAPQAPQDQPDPTTGLPPGSEPAPSDADAALMQQQMDALRQQMEEVVNPPGSPPTEEQPTEDN